MPVKVEMVGIIEEARKRSFSVAQIKVYFNGQGLWPVNMQRALNRLKGPRKRNARPDDRPPLADIPVAIGDGTFERSLDARTVLRLHAKGVTTTGVGIGTVMLGSFFTGQERITRPAISRSVAEIRNEGLLTSDELLSKYHEDASRKTEEERLKIERADARAAERADRETSAEHSPQGAGSGGGRGGRELGRGGGCGTLATTNGGMRATVGSSADNRRGGGGATLARPK